MEKREVVNLTSFFNGSNGTSFSLMELVVMIVSMRGQSYF